MTDAALAELRVELAGLRVERKQSAVRRAVNDPPLAAGLAVGPVGAASVDAARRRPVRERMILERIELPELLAGRRVEGHDAEIAGGDVHHAVDHDRRALDRLARAAFELAGVVGPGRLEPRHVFAVDLIERGIPHATGVVPHARPVDAAIRLSEREAGECQQTSGHDQTERHRGFLKSTKGTLE